MNLFGFESPPENIYILMDHIRTLIFDIRNLWRFHNNIIYVRTSNTKTCFTPSVFGMPFTLLVT